MSVTDVAREQSSAKSRQGRRLLLAGLLGAGVIGCGWAWWTDRRYKSAMEEIESEIVGGRYAIACRNLDTLLSWKTDPNGGIKYLLGSCELARGRNQVASVIWARVVPGSAFSDRAIRGRMRLLHESGQLAAAEQLINDAARDPRNDRTALLVLLVPMYSDLGRIDEAEQLIEDRWEHLNQKGEGALEPAIKLVRQHIELTLKALPVETVRTFLEQVRQAGSRRRPGLAGSSKPGDPNRSLRRGRTVARRFVSGHVRRMSRSGAPVYAGAWRPTGPTSCNRL